MTTREKILHKSLELFNERGSLHVTVRHIAQELNMSHGNLCYHFPNTDTIIKELYNQLVENLNKNIGQAMFMDFKLTDLLGFTEYTFSLFYEYRFLMLEFVDIMRRLTEIKQHYIQLQTRRKIEFSLLFKLMQSKGYLQQEEFTGQFDLLIEQMVVFGDFWMSEAEILLPGTREERIKHYSRLFNSQFFPYLTEEGKKEFLEFNTLT